MRPALHARMRAIKKWGSATFPALSNPAVILIGDSITGKENIMVGIPTSGAASTLTRDGTTHPGRITAPITTTAGGTWLPGTPRVSLVNLADKSFEVIGRNNYEDSTTTGISIHTAAADTFAKGAPSWNSTTGATTTQVLSNGDIINMERRSLRGPTNWANTLLGGGMDIVANLGHPGAFVGDVAGNLSAESASELAYAKQLTSYYNGLGRQVLCIVRMGINDMKPGGNPSLTASSMKKLLDGLTGADGSGGNAYVALVSCSFCGSAAALGGAYNGNPQGFNEQAIGKCATSAAPTVLNVDASTYTLYDVTPRKTYNRQIYELQQAAPGRIIFVDESSPTYSFTSQVMYDSTHLATDGTYDTGDGTHFTTSSAIKQGTPLANALTAVGVTFPQVVPRSSTDSTTPGGRTRVWLQGPWGATPSAVTLATSGQYLGGGAASTRLPFGGVGGVPTGWVVGQGASATSILKASICDRYSDGATKGQWVNCEIAGGGSSELVQIDPKSNNGAAPSVFGMTPVTDQSEYELVFEIYWDNAIAAGIQGIYAVFATGSSGRYGTASMGDSGDNSLGAFPDSSNGPRQFSTGRMMMSDVDGTHITAIVPQIYVKLSTVDGVTPYNAADYSKTANVGIRCVGVNKLP